MCESLEVMQQMLNILSEYYTSWKVHVNIEKTKVIIISKCRTRQKNTFLYNGNELDVCEQNIYIYLGVLLKTITIHL